VHDTTFMHPTLATFMHPTRASSQKNDVVCLALHY